MDCSVVRIRNMDHQNRGNQEVGGFETCIWCRMEKISWIEHKTDEEVLSKVEEDRSLMATIKERQKKWTRYIPRGNFLQRTTVEGRMEGREREEDLDGCCWTVWW